MNSRRVLLLLYVVVLAGLGTGAGMLFYDANQEFQQLRRTEAATRQRLAEAEAKLREQDRILERLRHDPEFVAKVIRQRLHYAKPGEVIFRFED